jgi:hypothetical protein
MYLSTGLGGTSPQAEHDEHLLRLSYTLQDLVFAVHLHLFSLFPLSSPSTCEIDAFYFDTHHTALSERFM